MILLQAKLKRTLKRLIPEEMLALENLYGKNSAHYVKQAHFKYLYCIKEGKNSTNQCANVIT